MIEKLPILNKDAKVILKNTQVRGSQYGITTNYYVTFEFADGTRKIFKTPLQFYGIALEDETGILSYKEQGKTKLFVDFQKDNISN